MEKNEENKQTKQNQTLLQQEDYPSATVKQAQNMKLQNSGQQGTQRELWSQREGKHRKTSEISMSDRKPENNRMMPTNSWGRPSAH